MRPIVLGDEPGGRMHLVQILLPTLGNDGVPIDRACFARVRAELMDRHAGLTAWSRAPAEGLWRDGGGQVDRDDVVVYEVMVEDLARTWWARYRQELAQRFGQEELVVRAQVIERL